MAHEHSSYVEGCFACKLRSVNLAPSAQGSPEATTVSLRDKRWDRDMPAYKRLRQQGLQPKGIDGCADLETRAHDQFEIETGSILNAEQRKQAAEGIALTQELADV